MTANVPELPRLELCCFGPPRVTVGGEPPDASVVWKKNLALLIYLALNERRACSRDHLMGLLWPEKPQDKARHSLNEAIRRLRNSLGAARIVSDGDMLSLAADGLEVDALRFEQLAKTDLDQAAGIPSGQFLEGFTIDDAPLFDEWLTVERTRLHSLWATALLAQGETALAANRFHEAQVSARQALRVQPFSEQAAHLFIRGAALSGDATGAQAFLRDFRAQIESELGGSPSPELTALGNRVRREQWRVSIASPSIKEPPLVGREQLHREVFGIVPAPGRAQCIFVSGEPGMGKTRLFNDYLDRLSLGGATVALARPLESDQDREWSTLRLLVHAGLSNAPGMAGADPDALAKLASMAPDLARNVEPVEPRDRGEVALALASLLAAIAEEQPVALGIDNAHVADAATMDVLEGALLELADSPVVLFITAVPSSEQPRGLLRLSGRIGRDLAGVSLELEPIDADATRQLVGEMAPWCQTAEESDRLTRRLCFEVEGNPLLAITILRTLAERSELSNEALKWPRPRATIETPLPFKVPDLLRMTILSRVDALDQDAREVLGAASVGDTTVDAALVAELTDKTTDEVEAQLEVLEQHHFVAYHGSRYVFNPPMLKMTVEEACLSRGKLERLRQRAVQKLATKEDLISKVLRVELLAKLNNKQEAYSEAMALAETALASDSQRAARRALVAAELAAGEPERRARVSEVRSKL